MNTSINYPKGSEWRKWDLHVHTPYSIVNNYEGKSEEEKWDKFIEAIENLPDEVKVIGITDYYFIDGYEKVMSYKLKNRLQNIDKIFPLLEFRIDTFSSGNENNLQKINLHILFNINESDLENEVKKIKEEFISLIPLTKLEKHKTKMLSKKNFNDEGGDLQKGFSNLIPPTDKVFELLNSATWKDKTFLFLGYKEWSNLEKNNQLRPFKEDLYQKVKAFFCSNFSTFEKNQKWLNEFGNKKLLHSGDIHDFNFLDTAKKDNEGKYISENYKCYTWIKADPTFEGLKQITYEPEERVFIGDEPEILRRLKENKTKFIKSIKIDQVNGYNENKGVWFKNIDIFLNPGLVAIIGNKGNGKSALTDIISLCGNSHLYDDFSFLKEEKFLKDGLAKNFEAELTWESEEKIKKNLSEKTDTNSPQRVRYLPQNFFERLTNNLETYDFEKTLEEVVFSYIPEEQKLNKNSFSELIEYKKQLSDKEINTIRTKINELNKKIIDIEKKLHPDYRKQIEEKLKLKQKEIDEHNKIKPNEILDPSKDEKISEELKNKQAQLDSKNQDLEKIEIGIINKQNEIKNLSLNIEELKRIDEEIKNFKNQIENYIRENKKKFLEYGLEIGEVIKYEINEVMSHRVCKNA